MIITIKESACPTSMLSERNRPLVCCFFCLLMLTIVSFFMPPDFWFRLLYIFYVPRWDGSRNRHPLEIRNWRRKPLAKHLRLISTNSIPFWFNFFPVFCAHHSCIHHTFSLAIVVELIFDGTWLNQFAITVILFYLPFFLMQKKILHDDIVSPFSCCCSHLT